MKLDSHREQLLNNVRKADMACRSSVPLAEEAGRKARAQVLADVLAFRDQQVRIAFDAGIPAIQIHTVGLTTKARRTLDESLARTATVAAMTAALVDDDPLASRYSLSADGETLTIRLDGPEFEARAERLDWTKPYPDELHVAEFEQHENDEGGRYLVAFTSTGTSAMGWRQHPVVNWADVPKNEAEALEWWRAKA